MNSRMTLRPVVAAMFAGFSLLVVANAAAQPRFGRPPVPRSGACFYRDADFQGDYFCVDAGEDIPMMPAGWNDQFSSIRTFGSAEVTVYRDGRFKGQSESF